MSTQVPRPKKPKTAAVPEVIVQQAVPVVEPEKKEEMPVERLSPIVIVPDALPTGMKSENRIQKELAIEESRLVSEKIEKDKRMNNLLKIGAVALGIGVGMILCGRAWKWFFSSSTVKVVTENIVALE